MKCCETVAKRTRDKQNSLCCLRRHPQHRRPWLSRLWQGRSLVAKTSSSRQHASVSTTAMGAAEVVRAVLQMRVALKRSLACVRTTYMARADRAHCRIRSHTSGAESTGRRWLKRQHLYKHQRTPTLLPPVQHRSLHRTRRRTRMHRTRRRTRMHRTPLPVWLRVPSRCRVCSNGDLSSGKLRSRPLAA